ncbi:MAG: leucyl aminopeptidase family protein, partial [Candidatus Sumerlaeaceae bacterium]|nr:leucyl aminopeptidase family protein [Candidatus Sumerlaeaceae bacterium]
VINKLIKIASTDDPPTLFPSLGDEGREFHIGLYDQKKLRDVPLNEALRIIGGRIINHLREVGASKCFIVTHCLEEPLPDSLACIAEGMILGAYRYERFKPPRKTVSVDVSFVVKRQQASSCRTHLKNATTVATLQNTVRDIINEPPSLCGPDRFVQLVRNLVRGQDVTLQVLAATQLKKQGYVGILTVGKGADEPPAMVIVRYRGGRRGERPLVFVGKAIMFDTGGYCLKPPKDMWHMKGDMAGGAAVLGAVVALAKLQCPVNVIGIIPCAKNLVGPLAYLPGDVVTFKNGKSVHVTNTDAEGRLLLADALIRAEEERAQAVIDIATLTGSVVRALGPAVAGIMGNDHDLIRHVIEAGEEVGESFWELPLVSEYREQLKSEVADLENVGKSPNAGAIIGGLFLNEFVPKGAKWVHLDIAGPFFAEKHWRYYAPGATGFGFRTLVKIGQNLSGVIL